jgi:AraC-like DNA-binding protein
MYKEYPHPRRTVYDPATMSVDRSSAPRAQSPHAQPPHAEDFPGDALSGLRVEGSCYCRTELTAPWGLDFAPCPGVSFHFVARGSCWCVVAGRTWRLRQGDLVVLPHSHPHRLLGEPDTPDAAMLRLPAGTDGQLVTHLSHGGGGDPTLVLCGGTRFAEPHTALVAALPPVLQVFPDAGPGGDWIGLTMAVMGMEAAQPRAGSETVIARLCDVLVLNAVRCWLETSPQARLGWLGALRDVHVGPVLALIHRHPERPWTVASMAAAAHLSRTLFAQRFTDLVGQPPIGYLTGHRMERATSLLRQGATVGEAARQVGYGSVAAFSRAYKHTTGAAPSRRATTPA